MTNVGGVDRQLPASFEAVAVLFRACRCQKRCHSKACRIILPLPAVIRRRLVQFCTIPCTVHACLRAIPALLLASSTMHVPLVVLSPTLLLVQFPAS